MELEAILKGLREERALVERAIIALKRVEDARKRRRNRPPAWLEAIRFAEAGKDYSQEPRGKARRSNGR